MELRTLKRFLFIGSISCLVLSSPAYATVKEALEAIDEQDYGFALEELGRLAAEDNSDAIYHLGRMYYDGLGVEANEISAMKLFLQAAEKGNEKAAVKV